MKKNLQSTPYSLLPIYCALFFLIVCFGFSEAGLPDAHKTCTDCHIEDGKSELKAGVSEVCLGCHKSNPGRDHPVNIVQKEAVTALPLAKGNIITCITCHEPHGKGASGGMLRMEFDNLCVVCHK